MSPSSPSTNIYPSTQPTSPCNHQTARIDNVSKGSRRKKPALFITAENRNADHDTLVFPDSVSQDRKRKNGEPAPTFLDRNANGEVSAKCRRSEIPIFGSLKSSKNPVLNPSGGKRLFRPCSNPRRRRSLVRRTHSPKTVPSPLSTPVKLSHITARPPPMLMRSKTRPMSPTVEEIPRTKLPVFEKENMKKRKRSNSPNNQSLSLRTKAVGRNFDDVYRSNRGTGAQHENSAVEVRMMAPTVRGITEAARILRGRNSSMSGILSVPTEKFYSFLSLVPFEKPTRNPAPLQSRLHRAWDMLKRLRTVDPSDASVFLYHPVQAYNFVAFSTPKRFVYKETPRSKKETISDSLSQNNNDGSIRDESTFTAVTFSESHEVLNRLSSAFWPGAVAIYAPVRTRRLKNSKSCSSRGGEELAAIRGHSSTESLGSLTSSSSEEGECFEDSAHRFPSVPVVPSVALRSPSELFIPGDDDEKAFVGMRCPSHPIVRRVLAETYGQNDSKTAQRMKDAVIGIDVSSTSNGTTPRKKTSCLVTCNEVCTNLLTPAVDDVKSKKPVVHVVNGEDRREMFCVPPCQFGALPSVSLAIDTPRRTIVLIRNRYRSKSIAGDEPGASVLSSTSTPSFEVGVEDVSRALIHSRTSDRNSIKSKAMAAVMSKWTVIEKDI